MRKELREVLEELDTLPFAYAVVSGSSRYPEIRGTVHFYPIWGGTLVAAEIMGLPSGQENCGKRIFGFHMHEGSRCTGNEQDPFGNTGGHFNPGACAHPEHAGDFPPLFEAGGYALNIFFTDRFYPEEAVGKTVVIHDMPDDFHTQPAGDSGMKIACGEIMKYK